MKTGWRIETLGEACDLIARGIAPKYIEEGGVRVINQKCIRDHNVSYGLARRNDDKAKRVPIERIIRAGDVLVNSTGTGTLGRVAQVRSEPDELTTVDTHVSIVRPKLERFFPAFFGYMLINIENELIAGGLGASGQTELPRSDLETKFEVSYPTSIDEQKQIVAVLDEAFEGLSRACANAEANLADARELFDNFTTHIFSEVEGEHAQSTLEEVCQFITDGTHQTPTYFESGFLFLSAKNVKDGRLDWEDVKYVDLAQHAAMQKRLAPRVGDLLIRKNGAGYGGAALVDREVIFDVYVSLAVLRPKPWILPEFLLQFANSSFAQSQFRDRIKGQGVPNLHLQEIRKVRLAVPTDIKSQQSIAEKVQVVLEETRMVEAHYQAKLEGIDALRQSLLQKAFSGELTR